MKVRMLVVTAVAALVLPAGAAAQAPTTGTGVRPASDPGEWISPDAYPSDLESAGIGGTVRFRLEISSEGDVVNCMVTAPSGVPRLDDLTCAQLKANARFLPARDAAGRPVAGNYSSVVAWRPADRSVLYMPETGETMVTLTIEKDGSVSQCDATGDERQVAFQKARLCPPPEAKFPVQTGADGKPERVRLKIINRIEIEELRD